MTDTTADILRKAKAHISRPENWNKNGEYFRREGNRVCACVLGATALALGGVGDKFITAAHDKFQTKISAGLPAGALMLTQFNDDPNTTHADIMALFDRAIALAESTP